MTRSTSWNFEHEVNAEISIVVQVRGHHSPEILNPVDESHPEEHDEEREITGAYFELGGTRFHVNLTPEQIAIIRPILQQIVDEADIEIPEDE